MLILSKILLWLKSYWYVPILILGGIASFFLFRQNSSVIWDVLSNARKSYKKELEELEKIQKIEKEQKEKNLENLQDELKDIEEKYLKEKERLEGLQDRREDELLENSSPEELTDKLGQITGIKVEKK